MTDTKTLPILPLERITKEADTRFIAPDMATAFREGALWARAAVLQAQGWVMVPVEPTYEMKQAALDASRAEPVEGGVSALPVGYELWSSAYIYRAMLAARPAQPSETPTVDAAFSMLDKLRARGELQGACPQAGTACSAPAADAASTAPAAVKISISTAACGRKTVDGFEHGATCLCSDCCHDR